jgi:hypothetical protein
MSRPIDSTAIAAAAPPAATNDNGRTANTLGGRLKAVLKDPGDITDIQKVAFGSWEFGGRWVTGSIPLRDQGEILNAAERRLGLATSEYEGHGNETTVPDPMLPQFEFVRAKERKVLKYFPVYNTRTYTLGKRGRAALAYARKSVQQARRDQERTINSRYLQLLEQLYSLVQLWDDVYSRKTNIGAKRRLSEIDRDDDPNLLPDAKRLKADEINFRNYTSVARVFEHMYALHSKRPYEGVRDIIRHIKTKYLGHDTGAFQNFCSAIEVIGDAYQGNPPKHFGDLHSVALMLRDAHSVHGTSYLGHLDTVIAIIAENYIDLTVQPSDYGDGDERDRYYQEYRSRTVTWGLQREQSPDPVLTYRFHKALVVTDRFMHVVKDARESFDDSDVTCVLWPAASITVSSWELARYQRVAAQYLGGGMTKRAIWDHFCEQYLTDMEPDSFRIYGADTEPPRPLVPLTSIIHDIYAVIEELYSLSPAIRNLSIGHLMNEVDEAAMPFVERAYAEACSRAGATGGDKPSDYVKWFKAYIASGLYGENDANETDTKINAADLFGERMAEDMISRFGTFTSKTLVYGLFDMLVSEQSSKS